MHPADGKKPPYVVVVDDQKSYADRLISRLKWRGIPEDHIIWFENAHEALNFVTRTRKNSVLGTISDYLNGTISKTTGAEVIQATRIHHKDAYTLLVSSEDRKNEHDVVAAGLQDAFQRKFAHKAIAAYFLNSVRDSGRIELIQRTALTQFHEEMGIHNSLLKDLKNIIAEALGDKPFEDMGNKAQEWEKHIADRSFSDTEHPHIPTGLSNASLATMEPASTPDLTAVKNCLLRLWGLTDELVKYGFEIKEILGDKPEASPEILDKLFFYKTRFSQDYEKRFRPFAVREMGYDKMEPLRTYITQNTGSAETASTIIHGINGIRDALGESYEGLVDCMDKVKNQLLAEQEQKTAIGKQSAGLFALVSRMLGLGR